MTLNLRMEDINQVTNKLELDYKAIIKNNEKIMIREYLHAAAARMQTHGVALRKDLDGERAKMKTLAQQTLPSDLEGGMTGQTADAAERFLKNKVKTPTLENPVKGV